ncbi:hypothetical protein AB0393_34130 [Streptomyces cyaneofuscatus]|uniref:hypothetical protein n=1 Tax=Streptomyces cyaneofuscatus TaxID=66883 RepID=UPI00344E08DE
MAAATPPAAVRDQVRAAAAVFEQASRAPGARTLQGAARALEHARRVARGAEPRLS